MAYRLQSLVVARAFEKDGTELGIGMGLWRALLVLASLPIKASPRQDRRRFFGGLWRSYSRA
jgi:hypothetical protein